MKICYVVKHKQYHNLTVNSIEYIKKFYTGNKLTIYIVSTDFPEDVYKDHEVVNISIPSEIIELPLLHQRVHLPHILKQTDSTIDKILFLDSDTIATTCIYKLYQLNIDKHVAGLVRHYYFSNLKHGIEWYQLPDCVVPGDETLPFYNCGVLLINIPRWIDMDITNNFFKLVNNNINNPNYRNDEPFLNILLKNKCITLDNKWNWHAPGTLIRGKLIHNYGSYYNEKPRHNEF